VRGGKKKCQDAKLITTSIRSATIHQQHLLDASFRALAAHEQKREKTLLLY
jgi:hypothetical protein